MLPLAEVRALVLERCPALEPEPVEARYARGHVLAADIVVSADVPAFASSGMDGFDVRTVDVATAATDIPVVLDVVDSVNAGRASTRTVGPRQAIRIMTGAPVPDGADAIVPVEMTRHSSGERGSGETVAILRPSAQGQHVRPAGDDVVAGTTVIEAGTHIDVALLGVLVAVGCHMVSVVPRPRVGVISTGDELVAAPRGLDAGQIRDSNRPMLLGAVSAAGARAIDLGWVGDDVDALAAALRAAATRCDLVLTSGGVSMGEADVVKLVLDRMTDPHWLQVAIRPAKPFALATVAGVPLLGLPGNPVSALVSFELLARPAIRHMAGHSTLDRVVVTALAGPDLTRRPDGKVHYVRVTFERDADGALVAVPIRAQGSHQLVATAAAVGLAVVPDGDGAPEGTPVEVIVLDSAAALRA